MAKNPSRSTADRPAGSGPTVGKLSNIDSIHTRLNALEEKYGSRLRIEFGGPQLPGYSNQDMWTVRIAHDTFTIVDLQLPALSEAVNVGLNAAEEWLRQHQLRNKRAAAA
jgi:hypothetical protein